MIDFARVVGFDWDLGNADKSVDKHGVTPAEAEQVFFNDPLLLLGDDKHSAVETRFHALGRSDDGRLLQVSFTMRRDGTLVRVISARDMNRRERAVYGEEA